MLPEDEHRLDLIRDSLIGVSYHLPNPQVILFPFLDNLLLLHQVPLVFAFWHDDECVYSSLKDPDFLSRHDISLSHSPDARIRLPWTQYTLTVHDFSTLPPTKDRTTLVLPIHERATAMTRALLDNSNTHPLPHDFYDALAQSIVLQGTTGLGDLASAKRTHSIEPLDMDYGHVAELLSPIRRVLDNVYADSLTAMPLMVTRGSLSYPNVFAVVRTIPTARRRYKGAFDYTAGMLLLAETKRQLREWCTSGSYRDNAHLHPCPIEFDDPEWCITALEQPLGPHSRSVSDLVFSSGIVDFGRRASEEGWDVSHGDLLDRRRRVVEQCIYPVGRRLFYIPIHVGGTPWLSIFTFPPDEPASEVRNWHHNYSFYRDLTQKTAAVIRPTAFDVYAELVAETLVKHMKSWLAPRNKVITEVNSALQELAQVYPFPLMSVGASDQAKADIYIAGRGMFGLHFAENPFFEKHVAWNLGSEDMIVARCEKHVTHFSDVEHFVEINATAQSSHLLKVPLRTLGSIVSSSSPGSQAQAERQIAKIVNLHDFAVCLLSETKRQEFRNRECTCVPVPRFAEVVREQYDEAMVCLMTPEVSGNLAPRLQSLLASRHIFLKVAIPRDILERKVVFFGPMLVTVLDGLLANAIDAVHAGKPLISVRVVWETVEGKELVYLEIENSTSMSQSRAEELVRRLTSPGPDLVGITEIHWVTRACWPEVADAACLSWRVVRNHGTTAIIAKVVIGEILQ